MIESLFNFNPLGAFKKNSSGISNDKSVESIGKFQCEFCSLNFNNSETLRLHLLTHEKKDGT